MSMGGCHVSNVRPLSDHNLVSTTYTVTENRSETEDGPKPLARAERMNFKAIDEEFMLSEPDWSSKILTQFRASQKSSPTFFQNVSKGTYIDSRIVHLSFKKESKSFHQSYDFYFRCDL